MNGIMCRVSCFTSLHKCRNGSSEPLSHRCFTMPLQARYRSWPASVLLVPITSNFESKDLQQVTSAAHLRSKWQGYLEVSCSWKVEQRRVFTCRKQKHVDSCIIYDICRRQYWALKNRQCARACVKHILPHLLASFSRRKLMAPCQLICLDHFFVAALVTTSQQHSPKVVVTRFLCRALFSQSATNTTAKIPKYYHLAKHLGLHCDECYIDNVGKVAHSWNEIMCLVKSLGLQCFVD